MAVAVGDDVVAIVHGGHVLVGGFGGVFRAVAEELERGAHDAELLGRLEIVVAVGSHHEVLVVVHLAGCGLLLALVVHQGDVLLVGDGRAAERPEVLAVLAERAEVEQTRVEVEVTVLVGHLSRDGLVDGVGDVDRLDHHLRRHRRGVEAEEEHIGAVGQRLVPGAVGDIGRCTLHHVAVGVVGVLRHRRAARAVVGVERHLVAHDAVALGRHHLRIDILALARAGEREVGIVAHLLEEHVVVVLVEHFVAPCGERRVVGRDDLHMSDVVAKEAEVLLVGVGGIARCLAGEQAVAGTIVERDGGADLGHVARAHDAVFGCDDRALLALAVHGDGLDDHALVHGDGTLILLAAGRGFRAVGGVVDGGTVGGRLQLHRQRAGVGARGHGERGCFGQEHVGYLHLVGGSGHLAHAAVVVVAHGDGLQRHRVVHGDGRGVLRAAGRGLRAVGGVIDGHVLIG